MVYEEEKNRLAQLLTATVGITRSRDSALEREAGERAVEARAQTGLYVDGDDLIVHIPQSERIARLDVPSTVGTAELADWRYLWPDPVAASANAFLNSTPHRTVLDNPLYTHWGFGIYTEMPPGYTQEIYRRWWFVIWLATTSIGDVSMAQPSEVLDKKVSFGIGTHWSYKFDYAGRIVASKPLTLKRSSHAYAKGRGRIPNRSGVWLLMKDGYFQDYWVLEEGFFAKIHTRLT